VSAEAFEQFFKNLNITTMRKLSWLFVLAFMAYACELGEEVVVPMDPQAEGFGKNSKNLRIQDADVCGELIEFGLFAGRDQIQVGNVTVSNDEEFLYVEFIASGANEFGATHLDIICEVPEVKGSPGQYAYNDYLVESTLTYRLYKVALDDLPNCEGNCFVLLAHAEVGTETAFAGEFKGDGSAWFNFITYCWQECYEAEGYVFKQECEEEAIPYAGFLVTLTQGSAIYEMYTDVDGFYKFEKLGPAEYTITVAGAVPPHINNQYTTIDNNFTVYFFAIEGTVYYDDCGDVAPYAFVNVTLTQAGMEVEATQTDENGWYKFGWLENGTYMVNVAGVDPIQVIVDGECYFETNLTVINEDCDEPCYQEETAWAGGMRYVAKGNWATYTAYEDGKTVTLWAGQHNNAGTVKFENDMGDVKITITLAEGWSLQDVAEAVKIQGYATTPPASNPAPGQFTTYKGNDLIITIGEFAFYGIHVDVQKLVECPMD
jgi:hypothetical protein